MNYLKMHEKIERFFKSGDFKAAVLKNTADNRPLITEYKIYDRASLHRAIENKAILLPDSTYRAARLTINYKGLDETAWGLYKRIVMMTYKSLDLFTLGFPLRNAVDSLGYKNINELGLTKAMKYNYTAIKMLKFHNDIQRQVLDLTENKTFNKESLFKVLENYSKEEQFCYFVTDFFVNSAASSGYSKAFSEYLEAYNSVSDIRAAWEKWYTDLVFKKESLGGGDIKMMFIFGLILGPFLGACSIFIGSALALPVSIYFLYKDKERVIPFGPFLLIALTLLYFTNITPELIINFIKGF